MAGGQEKPPWGVSSEMTGFHFIPPSEDGGTPCRRAFLTSWTAERPSIAVCCYPSISIKMGMLIKLHRVDSTAPVAAYWSSAP